jgi:uncharacterized membrane protein YiaA
MPFTIPVLYIVVSFLVGYLGREKKMGFWGYFFATLFLTPFIGVLLLVVSDKKKPKE